MHFGSSREDRKKTGRRDLRALVIRSEYVSSQETADVWCYNTRAVWLPAVHLSLQPAGLRETRYTID